MGENYDKFKHKMQQEISQNIDENQNPYSGDKTQSHDNEIALNSSKFNLRNRNFSDLVTNGKVNHNALMNRIKQNQSNDAKKNVANDASNSHILADNSNVQNEGSITDPDASINSKNLISNCSYTKNLINELMNNNKSIRNRTESKTNNSVIVSKSHANLDSKLYEQLNNDSTHFWPAFDILIETLSALESDIARNFKIVSDKFIDVNKAFNNLKFDFDSSSDFIVSFEKKIESLETRLTYFSDRDDDIWKMAEGLSKKIQLQGNKMDQLENKIHEIEMNRMENETSHVEVINSSMPDTKEIENAIKSLNEYVKELDSRLTTNEDQTRHIEKYTQRANPEIAFERRCDQMENDIREELDNIIRHIEQAKTDVKTDLASEFINFEAVGSIEQSLKHLQISNKNMSSR